MQLIPNQSFRNYSELCLFLAEPILTGGAKKNQLKNFETYFSFSKTGHKITITQIHKPLGFDPETGETLTIAERERKEREGVWIDGIALQVLHKLTETLDSSEGDYTYNELLITTSEGLIDYGFCNENLLTLPEKDITDFQAEEEFSSFENPPKTFLEIIQSTKSDITTEAKIKQYAHWNKTSEAIIPAVQNRLWQDCNKILSRSFNILKKRLIINYDYDYGVLKEGEKKFRRATPEEKIRITTITKELLSSEDFKDNSSKESATQDVTIQSIFARHKQAKFFKLRGDRLYKEENFKLCKKSHIISFTPKQIELSANFRSTLEAVYAAKLKVNGKNYSKLSDYFENHVICPKVLKVVFKLLEFLVPISEIRQLEEYYNSVINYSEDYL